MPTTPPTTYVMRPENGRWSIFEAGTGGERCLAGMRFDTATRILHLCATEGWTPAIADEVLSFGHQLAATQ